MKFSKRLAVNFTLKTITVKQDDYAVRLRLKSHSPQYICMCLQSKKDIKTVANKENSSQLTLAVG